MTAPVVDVHGLVMRYDEHVALCGVDLEVRTGEVFCVLGPNGAGKTTMVEILEGLRERTAGTVTVLGVDPAGQPVELRRRAGIVLQECALPGELRVDELLTTQARCYPTPLPVAQLLELVDLDAERRQLVRRLSGGQRRRLDLALALAGDPELVFLDEPTTGFDPVARRDSWTLIRGLAASGTTIVLTTHQLDEAEALADRIAVLAGGRVVACDTPARLGGRRRAPSTIAFELSMSATVPVLPGREIRVEGNRVSIVSADVEGVLSSLVSWSRVNGQRLHGLEVAPASLEDTYLQLIGKR